LCLLGAASWLVVDPSRHLTTPLPDAATAPLART